MESIGPYYESFQPFDAYDSFNSSLSPVGELYNSPNPSTGISEPTQQNQIPEPEPPIQPPPEEDIQIENSNQHSTTITPPTTNPFKNSKNVALSLALLISTITVGATLDTMGCNWINYVQHNIFAKLFLIFLTIYFSISFSHTSDNDVSPKYMFQTSLAVLLFYMLFSKMNTAFTNVVMISFFGLILYRDHVKFSENSSDEKELEDNTNYIIKLIGLIIIVGFWWHYHHERKRIGSQNFNNYEFMFTNKCRFNQ